MSPESIEAVAVDVTLGSLREGWANARADDIATVVGGGTPKTSDPEYFAEAGHVWITPTDLSGLSTLYVARGQRSISDKGLRESAARLIPSGSVVMSSRAPIGYVAIATTELSTNQG